MATAVRVRSPNYPVISLSEAVQKIRAVYQQEHMYPAARETIAKVLGYSGLNGASAGVVSAIVKYGLMEQVGADQIRVSADGQDVIVHRKGDPEYAEAVRRAALRPALFRELYDQYGTNLPSDHNLRAYLQKRGFNPKVVDAVIRLYRDTIEFVESETEDFNATPPDEAVDGASVQLAPTAAGGNRSFVPTVFPTGSEDVGSAPPTPNTGIEVTIPITLEQWVRITASSPLDEAGWQRLLAGLEFMKPGLVAPDAAPAIPRTSVLASVSLQPLDTATPLTGEAEELLEKVEDGGVPAYRTGNLDRIAQENGIEVLPNSTSNEIIEELMRRRKG